MQIENFRFSFPEIKGLVLVEPRTFSDERGLFYESYRRDVFTKAGITEEFVQDNNSFSKAGVLRGMHFQCPSWQGQLMRVIRGKVYDVAVDLRKTSPTFGRWFGVTLDGKKKNQIYIPVEFAHGFLALEDTDFSYKCTSYYAPRDEWFLRHDDPALGIDWHSAAKAHGIGSFSVAPRDAAGVSLQEFANRTRSP